MRILQIVPSVAPEIGGPAKSIPTLCKFLAKTGNEVVLYSTNWRFRSQPDTAMKRAKSSDGYLIKFFPAQSLGNVCHSFQLIRELERTAKDFEMVHIHSIWNPVASLAMRSLRKMGVAYCLTPRGMLDPVVILRNRWKKLPWTFLWEKANVENACLIHFTTENERQKALTVGWKFKSTRVIPNLIDWELWKDLPPRERFEKKFPQTKDKEVLLFVGRIDWVKNLDKLIQAVAIVKKTRPNVILVCVGPDNEGYQPELKKLAFALGIEKEVIFTGMLEGEDLKSAYARADVFALVSVKENFGLSAAEALACGVPVVLSEGVALGYDLPTGDFVLQVPAEPGSIVEALIKILERRKGDFDCSQIRKLAEEKWGEALVKTYLDAYIEIRSS